MKVWQIALLAAVGVCSKCVPNVPNETDLGRSTTQTQIAELEQILPDQHKYYAAVSVFAKPSGLLGAIEMCNVEKYFAVLKGKIQFGTCKEGEPNREKDIKDLQDIEGRVCNRNILSLGE